MSDFPLKIMTPDGVRFDGKAQMVVVRTVTGDTAVMADHIDYVALLGMGKAVVYVDGQKETAACIGGMIHVENGAVTLLPITFEWARDIDMQRAIDSKNRAERILQDKTSGVTDLLLAQARLKRALVRYGVAINRKKHS